jgi:hypothetical protein
MQQQQQISSLSLMVLPTGESRGEEISGDVDDTANSYSQGVTRSPGDTSNGGQEKSKKEKRDLTNALQLYGGLAMRNAHSALADADATLRILIGQLDM